MKVDSVITLELENEVNCLLLDKVTYNGDNYFLADVLDDNEEPTKEYVVLKEIIDSNEIYVTRVGEGEELNEVMKSFTKSFNKFVSNLSEENE